MTSYLHPFLLLAFPPVFLLRIHLYFPASCLFITPFPVRLLFCFLSCPCSWSPISSPLPPCSFFLYLLFPSRAYLLPVSSLCFPSCFLTFLQRSGFSFFSYSLFTAFSLSFFLSCCPLLFFPFRELVPCSSLFVTQHPYPLLFHFFSAHFLSFASSSLLPRLFLTVSLLLVVPSLLHGSEIISFIKSTS